MDKNRREEGRRRPVANRAAPGCKRRSLLVIDDDASVRDTLYASLGRKYDVIGVDSGVEAAEYVKRGRPDLIILDVGLPGKDGFAICKELRGLDECADTPVLFLTALDGHDDMLGAIAAGGDVFMTKPFEMYKLEERIEFLLKRRFAERGGKTKEVR